MKDRYVPTKPLEFDRILVRGADVDKAVELVKTEMDRGLWISVDDRLPEDGTPILGYADGEYATVRRDGESYWLCEPGAWAEDSSWWPMYWMPLPEPPE